MPIFVKSLRLQDYFGYRDVTFQFADEGGLIPMSVFYGPNGIGKTTGLNALNLLSNTKQWRNRPTDLFFRKMVYHPNYNPTTASYEYEQQKQKAADLGEEFEWPYKMKVEAVFHHNGQDKRRIISDANGLEVDELEEDGFVAFMDADHPMKSNSFQIESSQIEKFKHLAEAMYGYPVNLDPNSLVETRLQGEQAFFYQNFTIQKGDTLVHFKSMSAGEKKIATLLRQLCEKNVDDKSIILIDNIEMHIYFKRHPMVIDRILEVFPGKQFLVTTHSAMVIAHIRKNYGEDWLFDMEEYKQDMATYSIENTA